MIDPTFLEYGGAAAGIAGTILIASNTEWSKWAWPVWVLSSSAVATVAVSEGLYGIAGQQAFYTVMNVFGVWRWIIRPRVSALAVSREGV